MTSRFRPAKRIKPSIVVADSDPDLLPDARFASVGGVAVPRRFTAQFPLDRAQLNVRVTVRIAAGAAHVEQIEIAGQPKRPSQQVPGESDNDFARRQLSERQMTGPTEPVTPNALRELAKCLDIEVQKAVLMWAPLHELDDSGRTFLDKRELRKMRRSLDENGARRKMTPDHLRQVAAVYRANPALPRRAVKDHFNTTPSNASKWIRAARDAGYLKEAPKPGVSGEVDD